MREGEYWGESNREGGWQDRENTMGMQIKYHKKCNGIIFAENLIHHICI
jgi:hypothetical protein